MNAAAGISLTNRLRGWCPSVHTPMVASDGLLLRVKPRLGQLDGVAARALAAASHEFGNGQIDLTSRGNLQFRGFRTDGAAAFATAAIACGAADADAAVERRRNILLSPLADVDRSASPGAFVMAASLQAALASATDLKSLPDKFGFAVEAGGITPIRFDADVWIVAAGDAWLVGVGGEPSAVTISDAVAASLALARAFARLAPLHDCRRMRSLVGALGATMVYAAAGLAAGPCRSTAVPVTAGHIGILGEVTESGGALAVAAAFGRLDARQLRTLAELSARFGDGVLRFAPWRAVLIARVRGPDLPRLAQAAGAVGLIVDPADARLGAVTGAAAPGGRT